ncbi:uncharacterized protein LOC130821139 [Amaranthus tricolor]|uniref:uncharacterized protein LOC130821139 n=1 Tax=Amaranthus tricolor TaxID=29722 RepID=UPI002585F18A|nr:uncharacterized protein LOC130821139 [Amaranthus tricolor]XP_057542774.1 uncharacterized protein LOC130821139 [Amaranthus tricolor]
MMKPRLSVNLQHASVFNPLNICHSGNALSVAKLHNFPSTCINTLRIHRCSSWKQLRNCFNQADIHAASSRRPFLSSLGPCKAKSDDSGRAVSGESILLNEQSLERELEIAIEQENYAEAARIRDRIRVLHDDSEASVLAANARFYNAFRDGDLASMQALWAKGDYVCCVHPGASGISGYDLVMRSWEYVWVDYEFPLEIELRDVQVHVRGDIGYVTCVELVKTKGSNWGRQFATNVLERVDGEWLISVHHASPVDS